MALESLEDRAKVEASLVRRLQARDRLALADLYDRLGTTVYRLVWRMVRDTTAAENLTQETFLYVWTRIGTFDAARGSLVSWVGMVARSRTLDYVRSVEGRMALRVAPLEEVPTAEERGGLNEVERAHLLRGPWMRLRRCERQALGLAYYAGLSHGEIAEQLHRPLGTVKTWIRKGLEALRAELAGGEV